MAFETSFNGRCVVINATFKWLVASIMTGNGAFVRSLRYSVCPEKAKPASLIIPLCKGPVTMAENSPDIHPSIAVSSIASTPLTLSVLG